MMAIDMALRSYLAAFESMRASFTRRRLLWWMRLHNLPTRDIPANSSFADYLMSVKVITDARGRCWLLKRVDSCSNHHYRFTYVLRF